MQFFRLDSGIPTKDDISMRTLNSLNMTMRRYNLEYTALKIAFKLFINDFVKIMRHVKLQRARNVKSKNENSELPCLKSHPLGNPVNFSISHNLEL